MKSELMMPLFSKKETPKKKINYVQKVKEYLGPDPDLKLIFGRVWKMCDRCNMVFPEHYYMCLGCNSRNLRYFRIHNNMDELGIQ